MKYISHDVITLGKRTAITEPIANITGYLTETIDTLPGKYIVKEIIGGNDGNMLDGLLVLHESVATEVDAKHCLEDSLLDINVVGAVCGVYDAEKCLKAGVFLDGIWGFSATGFGGFGVYSVYLHRNTKNGRVDAFHVDFTEMRLK